MAAFLGWALVACGRVAATRTVPDGAAADVLWLPAEAVSEKDRFRPVLTKNGRSIYSDGSAGVFFSIAIPCDDVARGVTEHFAQTNWRPRSTEWLNPGTVTSFGSGCQRVGGGVIQKDSTGRPIQTGPYLQWRGEWEDGRGDILTYMFGGTGPVMRGVASYVPRQVVEAVRRQVAR
jgi:hypothetical protein